MQRMLETKVKTNPSTTPGRQEQRGRCRSWGPVRGSGPRSADPGQTEPLPGTRGAGGPLITAWPPRSQGRSPGNQAGSTALLPILSLQGKAAGRRLPGRQSAQGQPVLRASREALGLLPWGPRPGTGPWLQVKDSGRALTERGLAVADWSWGLRLEPRDAPGTAGRRQTGQRSVLEATTPPKEKNLRPRRDSSQLKNELPTEGKRARQAEEGRAEGRGALEALTVTGPWGPTALSQTVLLTSVSWGEARTGNDSTSVIVTESLLPQLSYRGRQDDTMVPVT